MVYDIGPGVNLVIVEAVKATIQNPIVTSVATPSLVPALFPASAAASSTAAVPRFPMRRETARLAAPSSPPFSAVRLWVSGPATGLPARTPTRTAITITTTTRRRRRTKTTPSSAVAPRRRYAPARRSRTTTTGRTFSRTVTTASLTRASSISPRSTELPPSF